MEISDITIKATVHYPPRRVKDFWGQTYEVSATYVEIDPNSDWSLVTTKGIVINKDGSRSKSAIYPQPITGSDEVKAINEEAERAVRAAVRKGKEN